MRFGYFDNEHREYVIDQVDLPVSWTNYIGVKDMYGVFNHTAGGYLLYGSPEYHRITRFRPNGVPMDGPGHYVYLRDEDSGDYWSISWQPVGKDKKHFSCRHGLSYVKYRSDYSDIAAQQTLFVPIDDPVEIWDVRLRNDSDHVRRLSVCSYLEFSFHHIDMDNRNFQMSLYAAGSRYEDGVIEHELHCEENGFQYFTADFTPDSFECLRDQYLYTDYGLLLNAPSYTKPDDGIGFVTRVYPGLKENGSIFSHPNPWAWCAEALLGLPPLHDRLLRLGLLRSHPVYPGCPA